MFDHHNSDGECTHLWRTLTHDTAQRDFCVLCGEARAHELRGPYAFDDQTHEWGGPK